MNRKPGSVPKSRRLLATAIYLCSLPAFNRRATGTLLDFAPDEVCRAGTVARSAVGSYPAISPLPVARRYIFCCAICRKTSRSSSRGLPGIMPCGARTFLHAAIARTTTWRRPGSSI